MRMRAHVAVVGAGVAYLLGEHMAPAVTRIFLPPDAYSAIVLPWIVAVGLLIPHAAYATARRLSGRASAGRPDREPRRRSARAADVPRSPSRSSGTPPRAFASEDEEAAYYLNVGRTGPPEEQHRARMGLARIFERRGMVDDAVALYEWSVDRGVRERDLFERLARAYRHLGRDDAAAEASATARGDRTPRGAPRGARRPLVGGRGTSAGTIRKARHTWLHLAR